MNLYPLHLIPEMPFDASEMLFFWYKLPYAVPGFITFVVGIVLGLIGLFRLRRKERIGYYLSFSGTCIGFGMLGLVLALRAVIHDQAILLKWNSLLYPFVLILVPSSFQLVYYILEKKYKILLWIVGLNWFTVILAWIGISQGNAFTGEFIHYSFGSYPVASNYLRPWGVVGAFSYILFIVPVYFHYLRQNSIRKKQHLVIGHNLLFLLVISNLPSFVGIPIFPGSMFSFIPMFILAYGVFHSDFRDLKHLLFENGGLFYILNVFVGIVLLVIVWSVLFLFSPLEYQKMNWYPWLLIPLLSVFAVVGLGIFIGGTNPSKPLNQLGAFSLYFYGLQLLGTIAINFSSDPLVGQRIQQMCYLFFSFALSIQVRFSFTSLNRPFPKFLPILDLVSAVMSSLAMTPYFFNGYYEFLWSRQPASGPVLRLFGVLGFLVIAIILREWWNCRKSNLHNSLGNYAALYISVAGLMLLGNLPATMGIGFYPMASLSILPTGILAFAVIRYGGDNVKTEARRISFYLLPFAVFPILLLLIYIGNNLPKETIPSSRYLHLLLSGIPLTLLAFIFTFVLIRPIANRIDRTLLSLEKQREIAEKQKHEIESLNQFTHLVNSLSNLNDIFLEISKHVYTNYNILTVWLSLPDEKKEFLYVYKSYSYNKLPQEKYEYLNQLKVPMKENLGGMLYKNFLRKKPLFLSKIPKIEFTIDKEIVETLSLKSLFYVPLVRKDECVGILGFTNLDQELKLSKKEIQSLSTLCSQVAGAIDTNHLLQQVEKARIQADIEKGIAQVAQLEAETERQKSEKLLLNILPKDVARELKEKGYAEPVFYESVTVMFTDFKGFTQIAENLSPKELIMELDSCFVQFDKITERYNMEKLKTIGDSYMCAGGIPRRNTTHAVDAVLAALEIQRFMNVMKEMRDMLEMPYWELRLGIHSGSLVAGVIGETKFAYDVWGDTVNTASRMESSGTPGKINISGSTYEIVKDFFDCEFRGMIKAKNKGDVAMYYVNGIRESLCMSMTESELPSVQSPNSKFWEMYSEI